jgi:hypothetical protein
VGVLANQQVVLLFSGAMNQTSVQAMFSLTENAQALATGTWTWASNSAVFTPQSGLNPGSSYVAMVSGGATDGLGQLFRGTGGSACGAPAQCSSFVVSDGTPPTVVSIAPANNANNVGLTPTVTVTFSEPMDRASVHLSIVAGSSTSECTLGWQNNTVATCAVGSLGCSVQVGVHIAVGARDRSGLELTDTCTTVVGAAYCSSFTTKPTHEECAECGTGNCEDVNTRDDCGGCDNSVAVGCVNVGMTYCVGCSDPNVCPGGVGCHYERVEIMRPCNCHQVCS